MAEINLDVAMESSVQEILAMLNSVVDTSKSTITASNTKIHTVTLPNTGSTYSTARAVAYFQVQNMEGTLRVLFTGAWGLYGEFSVLLNGATVYFQTTSSPDETNLSVDIYVTTGDVIGIIYGSNYPSSHQAYAGLTSASICGTITGNSTIKLVSDVANQGT